MFEVRNIAFSYGKTPVLRDVSFVVSPGETVSIVGANGAGKTTLLRILATLAQPDSGTVMTDGQDALVRPLRYRRQLGYMPERVALYDDMTVKEYLVYRALLKGEPQKRVRRLLMENASLKALQKEADATAARDQIPRRRRLYSPCRIRSRQPSKLQNPVPVSGSCFRPMAPPCTGRSSISAVYSTMLAFRWPA